MGIQYVVTRFIIGKSGRVSISQAEYEDLSTAIEKLRHIADAEEKFAAFIDNYFELEQDLLSEALGAMTFFEYSVKSMEQSRTRISRRIMNLLTSARLYVDSLPRHAEALLAGQPGLRDVLDAPSKQYDAKIGYRVMEALRNYSQHEALPVHNWSTGGARDLSTEPSYVDYSVKPALDIERLSISEFKKTVLKELQESGTPLELKPFIREYVEGIGAVHAAFRHEIEGNQKMWAGLISDARGKFVSAFPKETPVGLVALPVNEKYLRAGDPVYLSEELVSYIQHLQMRTHSMVNFARRRVKY